MGDINVNPETVIALLKSKLDAAEMKATMIEAALIESQARELELNKELLSRIAIEGAEDNADQHSAGDSAGKNANS